MQGEGAKFSVCKAEVILTAVLVSSQSDTAVPLPPQTLLQTAPVITVMEGMPDVKRSHGVCRNKISERTCQSGRWCKHRRAIADLLGLQSQVVAVEC